MGPIFIGVDVGTWSVRIIALSLDGNIIAAVVEPIQTKNRMPGYYEQSTTEIWHAIVRGIADIFKISQCHPKDVAGMGFDATCSLAVVVRENKGVSLLNGNSETDSSLTWNVILWMDHRAHEEARQINETDHAQLRFVGGHISPEMQPPKLLWLKHNMPQIYNHADHFMDLADFLTYQATESTARSLCCLVCKWAYSASENNRQWDGSFWDAIGLNDLSTSAFGRIGTVVKEPGEACGSLSAAAASELGLRVGVPVATSLIDAHAGCLGTIYTREMNAESTEQHCHIPPNETLCMIAGTSTCHLALSKDAKFVKGVWGPYYGAVLPGWWVNEAGQTSVGPALDDLIRMKKHHIPELSNMCKLEDMHQFMLTQLKSLEEKQGWEAVNLLAKDVHVWPDFHGNRSPLARPDMRGAVIGLQLEADVEPLSDILRMYVAYVQSFAYMTKYIIEAMCAEGHKFQRVAMCGGLSKSWIYTRIHADVLGLRVVVPEGEESVARGAAMLGACVSGIFPTLEEAALKLAPSGRPVQPDQRMRSYHDAKYTVFTELGRFQLQALISMKKLH